MSAAIIDFIDTAEGEEPYSNILSQDFARLRRCPIVLYIRGLTLGNLRGILRASAGEASMSKTRVFKSGNSQAVRIPAELAYADTDIDLEITRLGDVITIFPARNSLSDAVAALRRMPRPPRVEKREPIEVPVRRRD